MVGRLSRFLLAQGFQRQVQNIGPREGYIYTPENQNDIGKNPHVQSEILYIFIHGRVFQLVMLDFGGLYYLVVFINFTP